MVAAELWLCLCQNVEMLALELLTVLLESALLPLLQEGAAGLTKAVKRGVGGAVCALAPVLAAALLTDLSPVVFVAAAAALGIVIQNFIRRAK